MYVYKSNTSCILFKHFHIIESYGSSDVTAIELFLSLFLLITILNKMLNTN